MKYKLELVFLQIFPKTLISTQEREKEVSAVLAGLTSISLEGEHLDVVILKQSIIEKLKRLYFAGSQLKIASASASLLLDPSQE